MTRTAMVIVASTRAASGVYEDTSGKLLTEWLRIRGFSAPDPVIVADAEMPEFLPKLLADKHKLPQVLLCTGGTGLAEDDMTVDALAPLLERTLPGIVQKFYTVGVENTPLAVCSRAIAGVIHKTFIMALPGSVGACRDGITTLEPLLEPLCDMLEGTHVH